MTIKKRLIAVLILSGLVMSLFSSFLVWNVYRCAHQIEASQGVMDELETAVMVRARINRHINEVMDYLISGDEQLDGMCQKCETKTGAAVKEWVRQLKLPVSGRSAQPANALNNAQEIDRRYGEALVMVGKGCQLAKEKRSDEAVSYFSKTVRPWVDRELFLKLDSIVAMDVGYAENTHNEIMVRMGALPIPSGEVLAAGSKARLQLRQLLAIDRLHVAINRQMVRLKDYLLRSSDLDSDIGEEIEATIKLRLQEWSEVLLQKQQQGIPGAEIELADFGRLSQNCDEALVAIRQLAAFKDAGKLKQARATLEEKVAPLVDDVLLPDIGAALQKSYKQMTLARKELQEFTIGAGVTGAAALALVSLITLAVSFQLIRGMMASLGRLQNGVASIRQGNLEHRIELANQDELGQLATSFNEMCEELQTSQRDLTEAKEAAENYAEALKLSNEEIISFANIISHDLRAPLTSIHGFSDELQQAVGELRRIVINNLPRMAEEDRKRLKVLLETDIQESLDYISSSGNRMGNLIQSILNLARVGRRELKPERVNLEEVVQMILDSLAHQIEAKHVSVLVGELPEVFADNLAMQQILGNLIDNALKFLDTKRLGHLEITARRDAATYVINLRDNGRGIAKNELNKVFQIFGRCGNQEVPGEGMGLAFVKALVGRHGGKIWCESELGKGTTFSFTVPIDQKHLY